MLVNTRLVNRRYDSSIGNLKRNLRRCKKPGNFIHIRKKKNLKKFYKIFVFLALSKYGVFYLQRLHIPRADKTPIPPARLPLSVSHLPYFCPGCFSTLPLSADQAAAGLGASLFRLLGEGQSRDPPLRRHRLPRSCESALRIISPDSGETAAGGQGPDPALAPIPAPGGRNPAAELRRAGAGSPFFAPFPLLSNSPVGKGGKAK